MVPGRDLKGVEGVQSIQGGHRIVFDVGRCLIYDGRDKAAYIAAHVGG
jgi:hypothetical protein